MSERKGSCVYPVFIVVYRRNPLDLNPINMVFLIVSFLDVREHALLNLVCKAARTITHSAESWADTVDLTAFDIESDIFSDNVPMLESLIRMHCRPARVLRCQFDMDGDEHCHSVLGTDWAQPYSGFFCPQRATELALTVPCLGLATGLLNLREYGSEAPLRSLLVNTWGTTLGMHSDEESHFCAGQHTGLGQLAQTLIQHSFYHRLEELRLIVDTMGQTPEDIMQVFQYLPRLRRLQMPSPNDIQHQCGPEEINALARLKHLERLSLACKPCGLESLGQLLQLKHLEIDFGGDTAWETDDPTDAEHGEVNLQHLAPLCNLRTLVLLSLEHAVPGDSTAETKWLLPLSELPGLQRLVVASGTRFPGEILKSLTQLTDLRVSDVFPEDVEGICNNLKYTPALTRLDLLDACNLGLGRRMHHFAQLARLRSLSLSGQLVNYTTLCMDDFPQLTHLDLSDTSRVSKDALLQIAQFPKLKVLEMSSDGINMPEFVNIASQVGAFMQLEKLYWPPPDSWHGTLLRRQAELNAYHEFKDDLVDLGITLADHHHKDPSELDLIVL